MIFFLGCIYCNPPFNNTGDEEISFTVADVDQGLSQFFVYRDRALLFDLGPPEAEQKWKNTYQSLGSPYITAIVLSHRDSDHSGGLEFIDSTIQWSGLIITSYLEDTAYLRTKCHAMPKNHIQFRTIGWNDTILFGEGCHLQCLWPPYDENVTIPVETSAVNHYSTCFTIAFDNNTFLVTGDIDSTAMRQITVKYTTQLKADVLVVPHHGSAGSKHSLFYSYSKPSIAAISCGKENSFGHPHDEILTMLAELGIPFYSTETSGTLAWKSNGLSLFALF